MFNGTLFILFFIFSIGLGIVYNLFIIKEFPDYKRKLTYFITIIIFLSLSLSLYTIISVKSYVNSIINNYSVKMEQYIIVNYPENVFVKNGFDLHSINDDISKINTTVYEFRSMLPTHNELGVNKLIYDLIVDYAMKELQKRLNVVNYSVSIIKTFTDGNNVLTVTSVIYGLRTNAVKLINIIALIISGIFIFAFLIFIVYTLIIVRREKKFKNIGKRKNGI